MTTRPLAVAMITRILAAIVLIAGLLSGFQAFNHRLRETFNDPSTEVVPAELSEQVDMVRRYAPVGSSFFFVNREPEVWESRLWQRLLFPDPVFIIQGEEEFRSPTTADLRTRYKIRFAVSAGNPPLDLNYRWRLVLPTDPNANVMVWFGEIAP